MQAGKWLLAFCLGAALTAGFFLVAPQFRSRTPVAPPWHPFELRSDLTLDDLVADGYRVSDMPCGMVHFSKSIGDTSIRYWINIDCETYEGKYEPEPQLLLEMNDTIEVEVIPSGTEHAETANTEDGASISPSPFSGLSMQNPYWPFDADSVRDCYQYHYYRHYWFTMLTVDSLAIRRFVERHGGEIRHEKWNCSAGGQLEVHYEPNNMVFQCSIAREIDHEGNFLPWEFEMITSIPFIDHTRYEEYLERGRTRAAYYGLDR